MWRRLTCALVIGGGLALHGPAAVPSRSLSRAIASKLEGAHASALLLDWNSGTVLFSAGPVVEATPGSAIKPLLLRYALEHEIVHGDTRVYCRRNLRIGGMSLPCSHPPDATLLSARQALAESCNTWFAALGSRFQGRDLDAALNAAHLTHDSMETAPPEQRQLAVLGVRGVEATPAGMARAYREMLLHLPQDSPVWMGLQDAVSYGMSSPARIEGTFVLGKTGTAGSPRQAWTHGWFAGAIPGRFVLAVYVPHGDGGDAARLAAGIFTAALQEQAR